MMMKNDIVISFKDVCKTYKKRGFLKSQTKIALSKVSFEVVKGEIVGLLGLNGAGKTTIIKSIFSIIRPDSGEIKIFGESPAVEKNRVRIGYVPELPYFQPQSKAIDVLSYYAYLSGLTKEEIDKKAAIILSQVGLKGKEFLKCFEFSKGMLQRLAFAQALIHDPILVVMDEPVSGLDPIAVKDLRNLVLELNKSEKTFFLSSHSISELEKMCDRVLIIKDGTIVREVLRKEWENTATDLEEIFVKEVKDA